MTHMSAMSQKTAFYHLKNIITICAKSEKKKKSTENPRRMADFCQGRESAQT